MKYKLNPCNICDSNLSIPISSLSKFTGNEDIHCCKNCGFIHVPKRRSANEVAKSWSQEIFITADEVSKDQEIFTATLPAIRARLLQVLETIDQEIGFKGKTICDIGAGEGVFLRYLELLKKDADVFGIEPSAKNCKLLDNFGYKNFLGTIQDYAKLPESKKQKFDIISIAWTLECTQDCSEAMSIIWDLLKPDGHVVIATGSRILMPFKKPIQFYVGPGHQDTHAFRFSPNSLSNLLNKSNFKVVYHNRYIDNDILCMIGQKTDTKRDLELLIDDYKDIVDFFNRWVDDSSMFYPEWKDS